MIIWSAVRTASRGRSAYELTTYTASVQGISVRVTIIRAIRALLNSSLVNPFWGGSQLLNVVQQSSGIQELEPGCYSLCGSRLGPV